jgi:hypothetical protein
MLLRLQPKRDERAALAFLDLASALDAGLPAATFGGDPRDGDDMVARALQRRGAALDPTDDIVLRAAWRAGRPAEALPDHPARRLEQAAERGAPKYLEWYGAFALMVTLVWLYLEILLLLAKLNDRR